MRIYLQLPPLDDNPPRFCHLHLQEDLLGGWNLIREVGQQGKPGRVVRKHFENHDAAIAALTREKDMQVNKGFKIVFARGEQP